MAIRTAWLFIDFMLEKSQSVLGQKASAGDNQ